MSRKVSALRQPLMYEVQRFIRLRWIAALVVLIGALAEWRWLHWYGTAGRIATVGGIMVAYNALLWLALRHLASLSKRGGSLMILAWAQLLLDFAALTKLTLLTGGPTSPMRLFFFFHMVFSSLLLPRRLAYAGAAAAIMLLFAGLYFNEQVPQDRQQLILLVAWAITMVVTVWLANGITRNLRLQRRRLIKQNRHIRSIGDKLRRHQEMMIQQEKMAAAGRMAAGVAHEIANPLASMDGLLQLLQRRPEKLKPEMIETLREQVQRINQIVRRMTTFAHPGEGSWAILPLSHVVDKALEVLRFDPRVKKATIERQDDPLPPAAKIIPDALQQVIINLAINAMDAMESVAEPKLIIRTKLSHQWAVIEFEDIGHGIAPENRKRLFEPFFTTKPVGKGTGLGLSISYSLIRQQGGEIRVESEVGKGTKFIVRLPAVNASTATPGAQQPASEKAAG